MSSKAVKAKKVVNQDVLRRMMKERKQQQDERKRRVDSPYAKYNSLSQLSCVLCKVQVKTEILWQAHILGKQHKDKVSELKGKVTENAHSSSLKEKVTENAHSSSLKEKVTETAHSSSLKEKVNETAHSSSLKEKVNETAHSSSLKRKASQPEEVHDGKKPKASTTPCAGLGLLAGQYGDDDDDDDDVKQSVAVTDGLPADFFDSSIPGLPSALTVSHSGSISKADAVVEKPVEKKDNTAEALPEGFFDDPVRDAKVRNVETPKDHMDKEWEEFQKELRHVSSASEAIVAEEDEEGRLERQIDEIDEQMECLRRVEVLRGKQEAVKGKVKMTMMTTLEEEEMRGSGSGDDDEEVEEELLNVLGQDWRAKLALA